MKNRQKGYVLGVLILAVLMLAGYVFIRERADPRFLVYVSDSDSHEIGFYWKSNQGIPYRSLWSFREEVEKSGKQKLIFAMNGGMYKPDHSPKGLYVEAQKILSPLDTLVGKGNFYLQPNGVFYITLSNFPVICQTKDFKSNDQVKFATQSGPMLIIDGEINSAFDPESTNLNIRNGVGILPDNKVMFVLSKEKVNFYDFADCFKKAGCLNALYLDGFVSRAYYPQENWIQNDGDFGVIIGITENKY